MNTWFTFSDYKISGQDFAIEAQVRCNAFLTPSRKSRETDSFQESLLFVLASSYFKQYIPNMSGLVF